MYAKRCMGQAVRRGALLVALCAIATGAAACGSGDGDSADGARTEIQAAVRELQRAFAAEDTDRVCGLLSTAARRHVEGMGHGTEGPCYFDLHGFIEGVKRSPTWRERLYREVTDIVVDGDRATAKVVFEHVGTTTLPLVHERGQWRVDALYGGMPAGRQRDNY